MTDTLAIGFVVVCYVVCFVAFLRWESNREWRRKK